MVATAGAFARLATTSARRARMLAWPEPRRAVAAVVVSAVAGAWAVALRPSLDNDIGVMAGCAVAAVAAGALTRRLVAVTFGVTLLGAAYLASQYERPVSVAVAAGFASLLLATTELAWSSGRAAVGTAWALGAHRHEWPALVGLCVGGFAFAVVAGAAGVAGLGAGLVVLVAGAAGALLLAIVLALWVRAVSER